jgi:hypothetical protein
MLALLCCLFRAWSRPARRARRAAGWRPAVEGLEQRSLPSASTGVQAIGLANWDAKDVSILANDCVRTGGNVEVSFLPLEFSPSHPFDRATDLAQSLLPQLKGHLQLTAYLYFHRWDPAFSWSAFAAPSAHRLTPAEKVFKDSYLARVGAFDAWVAGLSAWAQQHHVADKLTVVLSPYLEDDCGTKAQYEDLLTAIRQKQADDHVATNFRRSVGSTFFRPDGVPVELHGQYDQSKGLLRSGDVYSNDGETVAVNTFRSEAAVLAKKGVSVTYWRATFNTSDKYNDTTPPSGRLDLKPLESAADNDAVLKAMSHPS